MEDFRIEVSSDLDYEGMVIDILHSDDLLAKLNCDQGITKTQIFIFDRSNEEPIWKLDYSSFEKALNKAFRKLKEVNYVE